MLYFCSQYTERRQGHYSMCSGHCCPLTGHHKQPPARRRTALLHSGLWPVTPKNILAKGWQQLQYNFITKGGMFLQMFCWCFKRVPVDMSIEPCTLGHLTFAPFGTIFTVYVRCGGHQISLHIPQGTFTNCEKGPEQKVWQTLAFAHKCCSFPLK